MFTGIIEELGTVETLNKARSIARLKVSTLKLSQGAQLGQSVSVNGVCLTVVAVEGRLLSFEIMEETIQRTNLELLRAKDKVNLERALKVDGRLDGHFVSGHIDGVGRVKNKVKKGQDLILSLEANPDLLRYIVLKGSVALDGVSLTVSALEKDSFCVNLIAHTINNTTLGTKNRENLLNIECDILAKYIDKFLSTAQPSSAPNLTLSFLASHGFTS